MMKADSKISALIALALLVPAPSLGVALAMLFEGTRGTPVGMGVFAASKIWILVLPLVWLLVIERGRPSFSPPRRGGLLIGAVLGLAIAAAIALGFVVFGDWIDREQMRDAAERNGIGTRTVYLALAAYWIVINALLEEYVWRWFVFRKCEVLLGGIAAALLSAFFFSAHHFLALYAQTNLKITLLGTLGVFVGGSIWSWCYLRYRSIWPGYISHVIADVGVFTVGWLVLFADNGLHP